MSVEVWIYRLSAVVLAIDVPSAKPTLTLAFSSSLSWFGGKPAPRAGKGVEIAGCGFRDALLAFTRRAAGARCE